MFQPHSPEMFLDIMCIKAITSKSLSEIEELAVAVAALQKSADECLNEVFLLNGNGGEWQAVHQIVRNIRRVMGWIDDLLVHGIVDVEDLARSHRSKCLMYQKT